MTTYLVAALLSCVLVASATTVALPGHRRKHRTTLFALKHEEGPEQDLARESREVMQAKADTIGVLQQQVEYLTDEAGGADKLELQVLKLKKQLKNKVGLEAESNELESLVLLTGRHAERKMDSLRLKADNVTSRRLEVKQLKEELDNIDVDSLKNRLAKLAESDERAPLYDETAELEARLRRRSELEDNVVKLQARRDDLENGIRPLMSKAGKSALSALNATLNGSNSILKAYLKAHLWQNKLT